VRLRIERTMVDTGTNKLGVIMDSDCKTGVNSTIYPGVRIGKRAMVGPGLVLTRDVGPGRLVLVKQELIEIENPVYIDRGGEGDRMAKLRS